MPPSIIAWAALPLVLLSGCMGSPTARVADDRAVPGQAHTAAHPGADFRVPDLPSGHPLRWIVYGDMRFTATVEQEASRPAPRQALVARIAVERPDAVFLVGDVPWHGGDEADYEEYAAETEAWRDAKLTVFPVLGNHEFQRCDESVCLEHWWSAFPALRGRRWYEVALGRQIEVLVLDSDASLLTGSEQASWMQSRIHALPASTHFLMVLLHHPPVSDESGGPRDNEAALRAQLSSVAAARPDLRVIVCAAHVHNYEHFEAERVVYLVSGGGGAKPTMLQRSAQARYRGDRFPNFHYLRFELSNGELHVEMVRLSDPEAPAPQDWQVEDRFDIR